MKHSIILAAVVAFIAQFTCSIKCSAAKPPSFDYGSIIRKTASMVSDREATSYARKHGLQIMDLTWEDTGRYKNSSVGPNISDMTIQVQHRRRDNNYSITCMPVIRYPNFSDKTGDISADRFYLLVGNEKGKDLERVSLKDFLKDIRKYLHNPSSWKGRNTSLLARRDSHILITAQACFLPITTAGEAEFNPVLFNYQSYSGDPAVLAILATREGTSVTVIDNKRDRFKAGRSWGQRLFFNQDGERASLTGKRMGDFLRDTVVKGSHEPGSQRKSGKGLNMVMLIQVPLKQKRPMGRCSAFFDEKTAAPLCCMESKAKGSNVENAVIGHGKVEGPFTEIGNLAIKRDPAFPIRVTVQFYKATDNGVVSWEDMNQIAEEISKVYGEADYVGSLVTGGCTGRPTEYTGDKNEPANWWTSFWHRHNRNMADLKGPEEGVFFGW